MCTDEWIEECQFHSEWLDKVLTALMDDQKDRSLLDMRTHLINWSYDGFLDKMGSNDPEISKMADNRFNCFLNYVLIKVAAG